MGIDKGWAAVACAVLLCAPGPVRAGSLGSPGCMAGGDPVAVVTVDPDLDLHLADGRTIRLAGIVHDAPAAEARAELLAWLAPAVVTLVPLRSEPDRWGRVLALVFATSSSGPRRPVSVTEALLDAGRALAWPDPGLDPCWPTLLRLEREAQQAGRGLWAVPRVLDPGDAAAFEAHAGTLALVAGRIASVHEGRSRLYLRFAGGEATGMAVALPLWLDRRMAKAGTDPRDWTGRRLRVRGLLDDRWGWQVEVTNPQQVEVDPP